MSGKRLDRWTSKGISAAAFAVIVAIVAIVVFVIFTQPQNTCKQKCQHYRDPGHRHICIQQCHEKII